jgi:hypothetical protein
MTEPSNITHSINRLQDMLDVVPAKLSRIKDTDFVSKPAPDKWSKKEILGHLIDSAANNHQRFIRAQYENIPTIVYDQNKWNELNFYGEAESELVILLWHTYNQHLLELIKHIPTRNLMKECNVGLPKNVTIAFLINDYVQHLEHHLKQILEPDHL